MSRRSKIQPNRRWIFADDEPEVEEEKKEKLPPKLEDISRKKQEEKEEGKKEPETTVDSLLKPPSRQIDRKKNKGREPGQALKMPKTMPASYEGNPGKVEEEPTLEERLSSLEGQLLRTVRELVEDGACEVVQETEENGMSEECRTQGMDIVRQVFGRIQASATFHNQEIEVRKIASAKSTQTVSVRTTSKADDREQELVSELLLRIEELQFQTDILMRQIEKEREVHNIVMANRHTGDSKSESISVKKPAENRAQLAGLIEVVTSLTERINEQRRSLKAVCGERADLVKLSEVMSLELKRRGELIFDLEDSLSELTAQQEYHQQCLQSLVGDNTFLKGTVAKLTELLGSKVQEIHSLEAELSDVIRQFGANHQEALYLQNVLQASLDQFKRAMQAQEAANLKRTENVLIAQNGLLEENEATIQACFKAIEFGRERYLEANQRSAAIYSQLVDNEDRWIKVREQFEEQIEGLDDENHYLNEDRINLNKLYLSLKATRDQEIEENRALDEENILFVREQAKEISNLKEIIKGLKVENSQLSERIEEQLAEVQKCTIKTQAYDKELKASRAYQERQAHNISDLEAKNFKEKSEFVLQIEQLENSLRKAESSIEARESERQKDNEEHKVAEVCRENEELKNKIVFLQSTVEKLNQLEVQMGELDRKANEDMNQMEEKRLLCEELALRNRRLEVMVDDMSSRERELGMVLESVASRVGSYESSRECLQSILSLWKEDEAVIIRERSKRSLAEEQLEESLRVIRQLRVNLTESLGNNDEAAGVTEMVDQVLSRLRIQKQSLTQLQDEYGIKCQEVEILSREIEAIRGNLKALENARNEAESKEMKDIEEYYEGKIKIFEADMHALESRFQKKEKQNQELEDQLRKQGEMSLENHEVMKRTEDVDKAMTEGAAVQLEEAKQIAVLEKRANEELRELLTKKEEECETLKGDVVNCAKKLNIIETQLNEYKLQMHEEMQAISSDLVSSVVEKQNLTKTISELESNSGRVLGELENAKKERDLLSDEIDQYKSALEEKDSEIRDLKARLSSMEKLQETIQNSEGCNPSEIILSNIEKDLKTKEYEVRQLREELTIIETERDNLLLSHTKFEKQLKDNDLQITDLEEAAATSEEKTRELESLNKQFHELEDRLKSLEKKNEELQAQLDTQKRIADKRPSQKKQLERGSEDQESTQGAHEDLREADSQLNRVSEEMEALKQRVNEEITIREEAQGTVKKQRKQLELLRLDLKEAQDTIKEYEQERDQLHSSLVSDLPLQPSAK
jgi:chromosome segregation ATPase